MCQSCALIRVGEPDVHDFLSTIRMAPNRLLGTATLVEASMVALGRRGEPGLEQMKALILHLGLELVPLSGEQATLAIDGFRRFAKAGIQQV